MGVSHHILALTQLLFQQRAKLIVRMVRLVIFASSYGRI